MLRLLPADGVAILPHHSILKLTDPMNPPPPVLYRFSKLAYLEQTRTRGIVRFAHARTFRDSTLAAAQQDNEQSRLFLPDASRHQIHVAPSGGNPQPITNVFDIKLELNLVGLTGKPLDYYIYCSSLIYDRRFYSDFPVDTCLRIRDPGQFSLRLEAACHANFPNCDFYGRNCFYYDPANLPPTDQQRDLVFAKAMDYGWQHEFRFLFAIDPDMSHEDYLTFEAGSLEDISDFYDEP